LVALGEKVRDTVVLELVDWDLVTAPDRVPEEDREGEEVELKEATLLVTEAVGQVEGEAVGEMLCELDRVPAPLLGVAEGDSVGVVVELKDKLPVGDDVEENEIRGVTLVEGLRERLPDCEALRVTVGELVMDLDLRAEKEFVGLVESDLDTAPEAVKEGEEVELLETLVEEEMDTEKSEVALGVGLAVWDFDCEEDADSVALLVALLEMEEVLEARGVCDVDREKVAEDETEGVPDEDADRLGDRVLVFDSELDFEREGEAVADLEIVVVLEMSGLEDCVGEMRAEDDSLGLLVFVRDTVGEALSVRETTDVPVPLGDRVKEPVPVLQPVEVAEEDSVERVEAVFLGVLELLRLGEPLPVLLGVGAEELLA
jgi:hypothetical protein